jgi:hypothetical protein
MQYILVWELQPFYGFPTTCIASGKTGIKSFVSLKVIVQDAGVASGDALTTYWE